MKDYSILVFIMRERSRDQPTSILALQLYNTNLGHIPKSHKNKLDHARAYDRFFELLNKKREEQESKGMVEDNSKAHLVDSMERKK